MSRTSSRTNKIFDFKLTSDYSDANIQLANTDREGSCFSLFSPWSRSTSKFNALIGKKLTGEFMRKIFFSNWKLVY